MESNPPTTAGTGTSTAPSFSSSSSLSSSSASSPLASQEQVQAEDELLPAAHFNLETPSHAGSGSVNSTKQDIPQCVAAEGPILIQWTRFSSAIHSAILRVIVSLSVHAARSPKTVISVLTCVSFLLPLVGFFTNLRIEVEQEELLMPFKSLSRQHYTWIQTESGFPQSTRPFDLLVHQDGANVLTVPTLRKVFEALEVFQNVDGYDSICASGDHEIPATGKKTCRINGATRFWWHNVTLFEEQVASDQDLTRILSADEYPLGTPVGDHGFILGKYTYEMVQREVQTADDDIQMALEDGNYTTANSSSGLLTSPPTRMLLTSAQAYIIRIDVPWTQSTSAFEDSVTEVLLALREEWDDDDTHNVHLEFFSFRSIPNEFARAIANDLPLYPAVFFIMCGFACITFYRKDRVNSRCLLGIGSVITIGLSLITGVGLMFIIGKWND
jgi:Patched family